MPALPQSNIHLDILMGRDESLDISDFFGGGCSIIPLDFACDLLISWKVWKESHRWTFMAIWRRNYGCNNISQITDELTDYADTAVRVWYAEDCRKLGLCVS